MHIFEKPDNLVELIENSLEKYPDNAMFGTKNKEGEYEWVTYREVGERIDNLRGGLSQEGIKQGDAGLVAGRLNSEYQHMLIVPVERPPA